MSADAEPPSWARDPWNGGAYCVCDECGAWYELVRPGKHQPTCDCEQRQRNTEQA